MGIVAPRNWKKARPGHRPARPARLHVSREFSSGSFQVVVSSDTDYINAAVMFGVPRLRPALLAHRAHVFVGAGLRRLSAAVPTRLSTRHGLATKAQTFDA